MTRVYAIAAVLLAEIPVHLHELPEGVGGEQVVRAFRLLKAQHVGLSLRQEAGDERQAQPDGVDVPGGDRRH